MSKGNDAIVYMFSRGYRVLADGAVVTPSGRHIKGGLDSRGYYCVRTHVSHPGQGKWHPKALVHRLVAYQMHGEAALSDSVLVRHLDDNRRNNAHSNIVLGSYTDNLNDRHRNHGTQLVLERVSCACCSAFFTAPKVQGQRYCSRKCARASQQRVVRPTKEELLKEVWAHPSTQLALKYGVTDVTIRDWCEAYQIEKPPRGYWARQRALPVDATGARDTLAPMVV